MRNLVLGLIGLVWGAGIVVSHFAASQPSYGESAYAGGRSAALVFATALVLAGGWTLFRGLRGRS